MKSFIVLLIILSFSNVSLAENSARLDKAIFAAGCFWCTESDFQDIKGVKDAVSGYTGGFTENPTYKTVTRGRTGHYEAVEITYDPSVISYKELLAIYWRNVDPFDAIGQFCDKGASYRSAIFVTNDQQKQAAEISLKNVEKRFPKTKIATRILEAKTFYPAEDYHQDYYIKSPKRYKFYRWNCGRDKRLESIWDKS